MIPYSINEFYDDIRFIATSVQVYADEVKSENLKWDPDVIIAIARGGCVPGVYLSHLLSKPLEIITWQTRDGCTKQVPNISNDKQVLIVDDINDSGLTFTELLDVWCHHDGETIKQYLKTACLITKSISTFTVDFEAEAMDTPDWIVFPWEREEIASHIRERRRNVAS